MFKLIQPREAATFTFESAEQFEIGRARLKHLWDQPPSPVQKAEIELLAIAILHWEATQTAQCPQENR